MNNQIRRKSESELLEEQERQAVAASKALPEPEQVFVTENLEADEQQAEAEAKKEAQQEDQRSDATDRDRILKLEELTARQAAMIQDLLRSGQLNPAAAQVVVASAEDLPRPRKPLSQAEIYELVSITIFADGAEPSQNRPVSVSVNGQQWNIPRGKPYRVPRFVVEVLEQAVIESWEHPVENGQFLPRQDLTPMTTSLGVLKRYPRFNFAYT